MVCPPVNLIDQFFALREVSALLEPNQLQLRPHPLPPTPLVRDDGKTPEPPTPGWQYKQWVICQSCRQKAENGWRVPVERWATFAMNKGQGYVSEMADCCGRPECVAALPEANQRDMDRAAASQWMWIGNIY